MKREFKVKDRIVVYATMMGTALRSKGTVISVSPERLYVELDDPATAKSIYAHPKQCRRLVKRKSPSVWISMPNAKKIFEGSERDRGGASVRVWNHKPNLNYEVTEFREVKRK